MGGHASLELSGAAATADVEAAAAAAAAGLVGGLARAAAAVRLALERLAGHLLGGRGPLRALGLPQWRQHAA